MLLTTFVCRVEVDFIEGTSSEDRDEQAELYPSKSEGVELPEEEEDDV